MTRQPPSPQLALDDPVSRFAPLKDEGIKELTDSGSFTRGRSYFRRGAIVDPVLVGNQLRAWCWGSEEDPYRVAATLAPADGHGADNPLAWSCTCPRGGFCKQVVALLLAWIVDPKSFVERAPMATLLAEKSREELVALIELMVHQEPDLERLIDLPMPLAPDAEPGSPSTVSFDVTTIGRQVEAAFRGDRPDDWKAALRIVTEVGPISALAERYAAAGRWADAGSVFAALATAMIEHFWLVHDEEGELGQVVTLCDQGLARCLDAQATLPEEDQLPPDVRRQVIQVIAEIWRFDVVDAGGTGISDEGPDAVARNATAEERQWLIDWLREVPSAVEHEWSREWVRRAAVGFQVMLAEAAGLDEEALLQLYRDAELWPEVSSALLELDRVQEAVALAARKLTSPQSLIEFADQLIARGADHVDTGLNLVDARLWETEGASAQQDAGYLTWLSARNTQFDRPRQALEMARRRFSQQTIMSAYQAVKDAATLASQVEGTWTTVRSELIKALRDQKAWPLLTEIALAEGDVAAAIASLGQVERAHGQSRAAWPISSWTAGALDIRVAQAAERDVPNESIRIYRRTADRFIAHRERSSYREAAEYLARIKRLLETNERGDEWRQLIDELRTTHKSLRALRDELNTRNLR